MNEGTKTVTLRVPLRTLMGCYDLAEKAQVEIQGGTSHTEVVAWVLDAFVDGLIARGELPEYEDGELRRKFRVSRQEPSIDPVDDPEILQDMQGTRSDPDNSTSFGIPSDGTLVSRAAIDIAEQVERAILGETDPDIRRQVEVSEAPPVSSDPSSINLYKLAGLEDAELLKRSPKDRFVAFIKSKEADPLVKQAVRVLYKSLPVELWGSRIAESQINLLIQRHDGSEPNEAPTR